MKADDVIDIYERNARAYDAARGKSLFEKPWLDRFLEAAPDRGSILDIGCGSGEPIARYLIDRGCALHGVDASAPMIDICRARFPEQTFTVADMRALSLNERFDGLIAWDSFFHLSPDDQRAMFRIFETHAERGAALLFTSGPAAGEVIGRVANDPVYHASLDTEEYHALLTSSGFAVLAHVIADPSCGDHTIWLARHR